MHEQVIRVECYSGYKAEESPRKLYVGERILEIVDVQDRWYSPGAAYFRVLVAGGDCYILRHLEVHDVWSLIA